jgi:tetratricopeptide (TPR) repeat protein
MKALRIFLPLGCTFLGLMISCWAQASGEFKGLHTDNGRDWEKKHKPTPYRWFKYRSFKGTPIPTSTLPPGGSAWMTQKWKGSDAPYRTIQAQIDRLVAQKRLPRSLLQQYKEAAQKKPSDPQAQFRYGYAVFNASFNSSKIDIIFDGDEKERTLAEVVWALAEANSPSAYSYARLRFLTTANYNSSLLHHLKPIGLRLLHRNTKDYYVKYYVVRILSDSKSANEQQQALIYAQQMVRDYPKSASAHGTLAAVYLDRWPQGGRSMGEQAIASYQKALELSPPNAANGQARRAAQELIALITQYEAKRRSSN